MARVQCHQYADGIQLYLSFPTGTREAVEALNWCLTAVKEWVLTNKLENNLRKAVGLLAENMTLGKFKTCSGWGSTPLEGWSTPSGSASGPNLASR